MVARIGPNSGQRTREPTKRFSKTSGGSYTRIFSANVSTPISGSGVSFTASSRGGACFFNSRASFVIRNHETLGNFRARIARRDFTLHRHQQADLVFTPMLAGAAVLGIAGLFGFDLRAAAIQNLHSTAVAAPDRHRRRGDPGRHRFAFG